jgi:diguanylate cyclase (GGDEF)-like protein/PAS domain S-box-containing protein
VCRFLPEGQLTFVNEAFCHYFGKSYHELIGQNFLSLLPEKKVDILQRHFALCFKNPVAIYDHQLVNGDGEVRWLQWTERAIFDALGYLIEFQSVGRDLTEFRQAQEQLRLAQFTLDQSADGVYWIDQHGQHLYVNDAACAISGYTRAELLSMRVFDIAPHLSPEQWREHWQQYTEHGACTYESTHRRKDGTTFPVDVTTNYLRFNDREYLCSFVRDITERKRMEEELREANEQLKLWIKELEQHNWEVTLLNGMADRLQTCTTTEQAYETIARYAAHIFLGQGGALYIFDECDTHVTARATWGEMPPAELEFAVEDCQALQNGRVYLVEDQADAVRCRHINVDPSVPYLCVPLINQSEKLGMLHLRNEQIDSVQARDQWKRVARMVADHLALALGNLLLRNRLHNQSIRDPLTGLFNRRYLKDTLEYALQAASRDHHCVGVVMLDIDHFKQFNDTYGHDGGDTLLRAFATLLQQYVRCQDVVCRYGGEEFTLILPGAPLDVTRRRAFDLCESIRHLYVEHEGRPLGRITASLGVASFPEHAATADALIKTADRALYRAKGEGRNRVIIAERDECDTWTNVA